MGWVHTAKVWGSEPLLSSDLNDELGDLSTGIQAAWDTYTPTRRNGVSGSSLSIGNGSIAGKYLRIGHTVKFRIDMVIGSSTALGSTLWTFSLPNSPASYANGGGIIYDDTDSSRRPCSWDRANLSVDQIIGYIYNTTEISSSGPLTWAAGDRISLWGTYDT